jgi:hypothetical protein
MLTRQVHCREQGICLKQGAPRLHRYIPVSFGNRF